jgi:hypothetical protein
MNTPIKAIWKREVSKGSGHCEYEEIDEDEVEIVGFVFRRTTRFQKEVEEIVAVCILYKKFKCISLNELTTL